MSVMRNASPRVIRTVEFSGNDLDGTLLVRFASVTGRIYTFTDAGAARTWLTRRAYNNENFSARTAFVHDIFIGRGKVAGVRNVVTVIKRWGQSNPTTQTPYRAEEFLYKLNQALTKGVILPEGYAGFAQSLTELALSLEAAISLQVPMQTNTAAWGVYVAEAQVHLNKIVTATNEILGNTPTFMALMAYAPGISIEDIENREELPPLE
jgi:hypothetical protein